MLIEYWPDDLLPPRPKRGGAIQLDKMKVIERNYEK